MAVSALASQGEIFYDKCLAGHQVCYSGRSRGYQSFPRCPGVDFMLRVVSSGALLSLETVEEAQESRSSIGELNAFMRRR